MPHQVHFSEDADRDWAALSAPVRRRVRRRLRDLARDPFGEWSQRLCGHPDRIRAKTDGYRILFSMEAATRRPDVINVVRIRRRAVAYEGYEFGES